MAPQQALNLGAAVYLLSWDNRCLVRKVTTTTNSAGQVNGWDATVRNVGIGYLDNCWTKIHSQARVGLAAWRIASETDGGFALQVPNRPLVTGPEAVGAGSVIAPISGVGTAMWGLGDFNYPYNGKDEFGSCDMYRKQTYCRLTLSGANTLLTGDLDSSQPAAPTRRDTLTADARSGDWSQWWEAVVAPN